MLGILIEQLDNFAQLDDFGACSTVTTSAWSQFGCEFAIAKNYAVVDEGLSQQSGEKVVGKVLEQWFLQV